MIDKNKYLDLYEHAPVAYVTIARSGNIISQNKIAKKIFGSPNGNATAISLFSFISQASGDEFYKLVNGVFNEKEEQSGEVILVTAGNQQVFTKMQMSIYYDSDVQEDLCRITITNIEKVRKAFDQQLRESEEKYRELTENINEGIYLTENGFIKFVNTPAIRMFGYDKEEMLGKKVWEFIRPEKREEIKKLILKKVMHQDGSPVDVECMRKDGSIFWGEISMRIIKDQQRVFGVISDISSRKATEQALQNSEQKLRELNATKDKLFSIIAHDLKSPYNAQLGFLELLLEENNAYTAEQRKRFITTVYHSTKQSFALLDNLLVWSRTQTGKIPYNPVELLVAQVFEEAIDLQKYAAEAKNIMIDTELSNDNLEVTADYEMLNTVLRNLLSNAIKFTPENGKILLGGKLVKDNKIMIYVSDTGVGLSDESQKKLFDMSTNNSTVGTNREKGTGIGLILCREFVERNGGKIWAESEENKGSTFYFTLESFSQKKKCGSNCLQNFKSINQKITTNKELVAYFENKLIPFFRVTYKKFSPEEITFFIDELKSISEKYNIKEFNNFSDMILSSLENEDSNQINICFAEFEKLTDELEIIISK